MSSFHVLVFWPLSFWLPVLSRWRWCLSSLSMLNSSKSLLLMLVSVHTQHVLSLSWEQHSCCLIVLSFWSCLMLYFSFLFILEKKIKQKKKELPISVFMLPWEVSGDRQLSLLVAGGAAPRVPSGCWLLQTAPRVFLTPWPITVFLKRERKWSRSVVSDSLWPHGL